MSFSECGRIADNMSCDAMSALASDEARKNINRLDYLVNHPNCERMHALADRVDEHQLQINPLGVLPRKLCVYKTELYGVGKWDKVMTPLDTPVVAQFDKWTRAK